MKKEEVIEAFYFSNAKDEEMGDLFENFPACFSSLKITPLNFQIHMSEQNDEVRSQESRESHHTKREKLSIQSTMTKFDLKRTFLSDIIANKEKHDVFAELTSGEEKAERLWLYIDKNTKLRGPFTCKEIQKKFEDGELEPSTKVKKKLDENWSQMNMLMNHFMKLSLIQKFETGQSSQDVLRASMVSFEQTKNDPKKASLNIGAGVKNWVQSMKQRTAGGGVRQYAISMNESSNKKTDSDIETISMKFNKPKVFDSQSKGGKNDPKKSKNSPAGALFDSLQDEFKTPAKDHKKQDGRKSFNNTAKDNYKGQRGSGGNNEQDKKSRGGGTASGKRHRIDRN